MTSEDGDAQASGGAIYKSSATRITHSVISGNRPNSPKFAGTEFSEDRMLRPRV